MSNNSETIINSNPEAERQQEEFESLAQDTKALAAQIAERFRPEPSQTLSPEAHIVIDRETPGMATVIVGYKVSGEGDVAIYRPSSITCDMTTVLFHDMPEHDVDDVDVDEEPIVMLTFGDEDKGDQVALDVSDGPEPKPEDIIQVYSTEAGITGHKQDSTLAVRGLRLTKAVLEQKLIS